MPELPDVALFQRYLDRTSLHRPVAKTSVSDERILEEVTPQKLSRRLKGCDLHDTHRHGKHLFVQAGDHGWLVLHFGMTGDLDHGRGEPPDYTRLLLDFEDGTHLSYTSRRMLGHVSWTGNVDSYVDAHELGPDALSGTWSRERFARLLASHRSGIKPLLMNQSLIAGLGNVWTDEVLFHAGLHPKARSDRLGHDEVSSLYKAMRSVLKKAVRLESIPESIPDQWLLAHRDEAKKCPKCGGELQRLDVSGRTAVVCPRCQRLD